MDDMGNFDIPVLRERMLAKLGGKADAYPLDSKRLMHRTTLVGEESIA